MSDSTAPTVPLRHVLATLAYRGGKVTRDAPERFGKLSVGKGSKTAVEILTHMCDVLAWGTSWARGEQKWEQSEVQNWHVTVERFHGALADFDAVLASGTLACKPEELLQGPLADCLTHVGQIALLRRLADAPIKAENYSQAGVTIGRLGADQVPPAQEF